jgi:hypothetical protein
MLQKFYLQIWLYCLEETAWWKGAVYPAGTLVRMAGSGAEENRYGIYQCCGSGSGIRCLFDPSTRIRVPVPF